MSGHKFIHRLLPSGRLGWGLLLFLVCACDTGKPKIIIGESKGLPSELLLVVDKPVWESDLQDTIKTIVEAQVPGLAQSEQMFRVTRIFSQYYDRMFGTMHSQLFVTVDPKLRKPMTGVSRYVTAKPQIEVTVSAPTQDALRAYLSANRQRIQDLLCDGQIEMRTANLQRKYCKRVSDQLKQVLGMDIRVPEDLKATKKGSDFLWCGTNRNQKDQNVVVYSLPWDGNTGFDLWRAMERRDSVMKENIPGDRPDQWMQTAREEGEPLVSGRVRNIQGRDVLEVRGLWEMRNGALGGPFVCIVQVDTTRRKVIVAEGFVYSPSTEKRDLMRELEASLRTLKQLPQGTKK